MFQLQVERYDREHLSLKVDLVTCVTDMFNRQQVSSDPGIRLYDKQVHLEPIIYNTD